MNWQTKGELFSHASANCRVDAGLIASENPFDIDHSASAPHHRAMLSRRQRLMNLYARYMQKPLLAIVQPQWLARHIFTLNAIMAYRRPKGLRTKTLPLRCTQCAVDDQPTYGTIFYIHGGAFVIGNLTGYRHLIATMARDTRMRGIYAGYRMAPEDPAPAALNDLTAAYAAIAADHASGPIAIVGDSAGGNLALALLHRILAHRLTRPYAVVALSPVTDLSLRNPSLVENQKRDLLVPMSWGQRGVTQYLAGQDPSDPELSPINGIYTGAPPVLIHVDKTEVLYDDARLMTSHLRDQGVEVDLRETEGLPHVNHLNVGRTPEADAAVRHITDFLNARRT